MVIYKLIVEDETGRAILTWYNQSYLKNRFKVGEIYHFFGKVKKVQNRIEMLSPVFDEETKNKNTGKIIPIYPLTYNLSQNVLRGIIENAITLVNNKLPEKIEIVGYILISDIIRKNSKEILNYFEKQGVAIKLISGDNPITVSNIAKKAGVKDYENYIDARTLKTEEDIKKAAIKYTIFGRVTPEQKKQIILALKEEKHTVAMTGDGVNDVLALKNADCSITCLLYTSDAADE